MIRRPESMWLQSARETFYKASDAFFKANAAASYNDWKRARAHWDYVYSHSAFQMCMQHAVIHATNGTCQRSQHANIPVLILADRQRVSGVRFPSAVFLCALFVCEVCCALYSLLAGCRILLPGGCRDCLLVSVQTLHLGMEVHLLFMSECPVSAYHVWLFSVGRGTPLLLCPCFPPSPCPLLKSPFSCAVLRPHTLKSSERAS